MLGCGGGHPALGIPAWAGVRLYDNQGPFLIKQPFLDSVIRVWSCNYLLMYILLVWSMKHQTMFHHAWDYVVLASRRSFRLGTHLTSQLHLAISETAAHCHSYYYNFFCDWGCSIGEETNKSKKEYCLWKFAALKTGHAHLSMHDKILKKYKLSHILQKLLRLLQFVFLGVKEWTNEDCMQQRLMK